jgi:CDP-paratose 2-epimerase
VLVTGGCGFLGSHICEYYKNKGAEVVSIDNMTKHELMRTGYAADSARMHNWNFLEKLGVKMIKGDIRKKEDLINAAKDCDFIAHTAAQPAMTISVENPELDIMTNVVGTFNVLEAARKYNLPVVSCGTGHIYGPKLINESIKEEKTRYTRKPLGISEDLPTLQGELTPLHASKRSAEIYVQTYASCYGLKTASFRLTGIYGTRQFGGEDHGWVANFAIRAIMGKPIRILGNGKQTRDIIYASDVAAAFDAFYKKQKSGIYNIGGGPKTMISLLECVDLIEKILGKKPEVEFGPERFGDLKYYVCDITKAKKEMGWEPKIMPEQGVKMLVEWIQTNKNLFK